MTGPLHDFANEVGSAQDRLYNAKMLVHLISDAASCLGEEGRPIENACYLVSAIFLEVRDCLDLVRKQMGEFGEGRS
jgi:hypothetical protein